MLNANIDRPKLEKYEDKNGSRMKVNREYLLRKGVAAELNTYLNWNEFNIFGDIMNEDQLGQYYKGINVDPGVGAPGAKSIFNKYGAVPTGGKEGDSKLNISLWRLNNNVPLIDTPENRKKMRSHSNCTIKELVDASSKGMLGLATYAYSDFMYCKYLGTIPNNYLITLRRFPAPVDDYISTIGDTSSFRSSSEVKSDNTAPVGSMITWLNTPGNELEQILTYSTGMPFEEKQSQWESGGIDADNSSKPLNAIAAGFDKKYREQVSAGYAGAAIFGNKYVSKVFHTEGMDAPYHGLMGWKDQNKVYGPIYAVKKTYYPSERGIDFNQSFKLTFEYEIRSYNGINGRQAMLDLISNILQVTYTTGTFWGGGYRGSGAHQNNIFANLKIMNTKGGFTDFVDAFFQDAAMFSESVLKSSNFSMENLGKSILNFLNNLGGMLAGGLLNKLGRPQKAMVNSLLSPNPVGLWHVTIGNPFHPIMSMGNMILKNTTITHTGPLGIDDFPTGLKVECELERGKPRDLRGIEMLYMNGNDRIYYPMGKETANMYRAAKQYKLGEEVEESVEYFSDGSRKITKSEPGNSSATRNIIETVTAKNDPGWAERLGLDPKNATVKSVHKSLTVITNGLKHYFGTDDQNKIIFTSEEQEYGSQPKTEKK